ncbi:MAG: hypothetical protein ACPLTR_11620, partial [Thermacetogeniaceae bacterium]
PLVMTQIQIRFVTVFGDDPLKKENSRSRQYKICDKLKTGKYFRTGPRKAGSPWNTSRPTRERQS